MDTNGASDEAEAPQSFLTKAQQVALDAALLSKEKAARALFLLLVCPCRHAVSRLWLDI